MWKAVRQCCKKCHQMNRRSKCNECCVRINGSKHETACHFTLLCNDTISYYSFVNVAVVNTMCDVVNSVDVDVATS